MIVVIQEQGSPRIVADIDAVTLYVPSYTLVTDGNKGDVSVSNNGGLWSLNTGSVTYDKIQTVTAGKILGRRSSSSGAVEELTLGSGLSISGTTLYSTGGGGGGGITDGDKGDITVSAGGTVWTIDDSAVTLAKLQNISAGSLLGRNALSGTGAPQQITLGAGFSLSGGVLNYSETGTVQSVSIVSVNGVSGSVANPTTAPAISIALGAITPTSVNGLTITTSTGTFTVSNLKTFSVSNTLTLAGTDGSTLNVGAGGTLGSAAFTASSAYDASGAASSAVSSHAALTSGVHGITAFAASFLDDIDAAAVRATLGLGTLATQNGTFSGSSSGTNTGDQTITLTGDVTGTGTGSFAATIGNGVVTLGKMADMATASLIYRKTAGAGAPEVNTLATLKTDLGLTGTNTGDQTITLTGDVTGSGTGSFATTIGSNVVTFGKFVAATAASVLVGRGAGAGAGNFQEITLGSGLSLTGTVLSSSGSGLTDGDKGDITVSAGGTVWTIDAGVVSYSKIQDTSSASVIIGRGSAAGAGSVQELSVGTGLVMSGTSLTVDAELAAVAGLTSAADSFPYFTGSGTAALLVIGSAMRTFLNNPTSANLASAVTNETGSGSLVFATSPTLVTPILGVATATSLNSLTITTSTGTLTIANLKTLTVNKTLTFDGVDGSTLNVGSGGTLGSAAFTASSAYQATDAELTALAGLVSAADSFPYFTGSGTAALLVIGSAMRTFLGAGTSANLAAAISDETGSGSLVFATSPTLVTPVLGVASATSINKVAITAPATSATLTIADGKTLTCSNTLTFAGTDGSTVTLGAGGTVLYSGGALGTPSSGTLTNCTGLPLSTGITGFAANVITFLGTPSSANLAAVLTDETGSGKVVFSTAPTFDSTITVGTASGTTGAVLLNGTTSGTVTFTVAAAAGTHTVKLPTADGSANQVLKTDGAGQWGWVGISQTKVRQISVVFDGQGSTLTVGTKAYLSCPFAGTITKARILADQSGSCVVDIWKDTYANYPPTIADTITASAKPTLSAAQKNEDSTLTGWTTSVSAGDTFVFNVDSATTVTRVTVVLEITTST